MSFRQSIVCGKICHLFEDSWALGMGHWALGMGQAGSVGGVGGVGGRGRNLSPHTPHTPHTPSFPPSPHLPSPFHYASRDEHNLSSSSISRSCVVVMAWVMTRWLSKPTVCSCNHC